MEAAKAGLQIPAVHTETNPEWRLLLFGPNPNRTLLRVVVWGTLAITFFHHLLVPIQVVGSSMAPTYRNGSLNFVNKWSYATRPPHRGDVIALHAEGELLLKRIVGLPGEKIEISNGELRVDGAPLSDEFANLKIPWEMDLLNLGENEYFVIGDNRSASVFCPVEKKQIVGKVLF